MIQFHTYIASHSAAIDRAWLRGLTRSLGHKWRFVIALDDPLATIRLRSTGRSSVRDTLEVMIPVERGVPGNRLCDGRPSYSSLFTAKSASTHPEPPRGQD